jgi:hypothetical protein
MFGEVGQDVSEVDSELRSLRLTSSTWHTVTGREVHKALHLLAGVGAGTSYGEGPFAETDTSKWTQ